MAKRVQTGCATCVRCTGSALGNLARSSTEGAGRALAGVMTLGISAALTKKCKACGHRMADHHTTPPAPHAPPVNQPAPGAVAHPAPHWPTAPQHYQPPAPRLTIEQRGAALRELKAQHDEGLITDAEYQAERQRIMNS